MKKLRVANIEYPQKDAVLKAARYYRVHMGNGCVRYFSSKRKANAFLSELNAFLDQMLHELNALYMEAHQRYRKVWAYYSEVKPDPEVRIRENLEKLDELLDFLPRRSRQASGAYVVFQDFQKGFGKVAAVVRDLERMHEHRSAFIELRELATLKRRIEWAKREMAAFGYEDARDRMMEPDRPAPKWNKWSGFG